MVGFMLARRVDYKGCVQALECPLQRRRETLPLPLPPTTTNLHIFGCALEGLTAKLEGSTLWFHRPLETSLRLG